MQRTPVATAHDIALRRSRIGASGVSRHRDEAAQLAVESFYASEMRLS